MSNKRITDLTELTTPTTDDVFPIVDIATNTTQKVQVGNLPIQTAVTTALATKQDTLVSGTNIKTVNSTSLVGSGNVAVQPTLVSGTNIKTINSTTLLGSGDIAVQPTLVSGTNIKTLNSVSLLGSGDIVLTANPSGVSGAIQFSNGSAFASDAANLFWDDTNNRLGVGTNAPTEIGHFYNTALADIYLKVQTTQSRTAGFVSQNSTSNWFAGTQYSAASAYQIFDQTNNRLQLTMFNTGNSQFSISNTAMGAKLGIQGSGSTSATTSLLVQNSAGTAAVTVKDDLSATFGGNLTCGVGATLRFTGGGSPRIRGFNDISIEDDADVHLKGIYNGNTRLPKEVIVGANTTQNASAQFQVDSTTKGVLFPRMTTTQKNAISTPAAGLVVYDSTTNKLCCYNGSSWNDLF